MGHGASEIRPPLSEVVIDVDGRETRRGRATFERRQSDRHRLGLRDKTLRPLECEIVDDIDQQERRVGDRNDRGAASRP